MRQSAVWGLGLAVFTVVALASAGIRVSWRQSINRPDHIARECEFIAALEKKRLIVSEDFGPAPLEWRRVEAVTGEPRPWGLGEPHSLKHRLIGIVLDIAPKNDSSIDCGAALDIAEVPRSVGNTGQRALDQLDTFGRAKYSRVIFLPGGAYAIVSRTFCDVTRRIDLSGWDQETRTELWRRDNKVWVVAEPRLELLLWKSPKYQLPSRCFAPEVSG